MFDSTLGNLDSICDPSYHTALINIAGLAVANQTIKVFNVPDPALLRVAITRATGSQVVCTVGNGGISYTVASNGDEQVHFRAKCQRRFDDTAISVSLLCAG